MPAIPTTVADGAETTAPVNFGEVSAPSMELSLHVNMRSSTKAWRKHRDSYPDEDTLKDFLAELFDKDRTHIDKISWEVWGAWPTQIELPSHMRGRISWP